MMEKNKHFIIENLIILVIAIGFIIWCLVFIFKMSLIGIDGKRYFTLFDDAMISMRYAWNFSHGFGLVWNPGQFVEGYTNLLMTLLMSLGTWLFSKSDSVLFIQILGIVIMLGIAYVTMRIADQILEYENIQHRSLIRILTFACPLAYYPLVYWSLTGMETGLLTILLSVSILFALRFISNRKTSNLVFMAISLGLTFLTRTDSGVFAFIIFLFILIELIATKTKRLAIQMIGPLAIFLVFILGQLIFRWSYYGEWVPNTAILKLSGIPLLTRIKNGVVFIKPFLSTSLVLLLLISFELIFNFTRTRLFFISLICAACVYQIWAGGDPWPYWRMLSPIMPIVFLLFIQASWAIIRVISNSGIFREYFLRHPIFSMKMIEILCIVLITFFGIWRANEGFRGEILFINRPFTSDALASNVNVAIALNYLTKPDATVGVFWAGTIPFYTGRVAFDFLGKNDAYISHLPPHISGTPDWTRMSYKPGHNKYDLEYSIKTLKPTYVQSYIFQTQDLSEYAKVNYQQVEYKGVTLLLLKNSPSVNWNLIKTP
jgi:hypothetical protein